MQREIEHRFIDLGNGPWVVRAQEAVSYLMPHSPLADLEREADVIDAELIESHLLPSDQKRQQELRRVLRQHWGAGNQVVSGIEISVRDSFDFALTYLMLLELAVETAYLPLDAVRQPARTTMLNLLWSEGAQGFLELYDYLPVHYLAARVGFRLRRNAVPPPVNSGGAIHFALFLDHERHWLNEPLVEAWLGFLDDYIEHSNEPSDFYAFLQQRFHPLNRLRFNRLLAGAERSVIMLADLFGSLDDTERERFGLFYGYWLAKLFGFRLGDNGFEPDTDRWHEGQSWAQALRNSPALQRPSPTSGLSTLEKASRVVLPTESLDTIEKRLLVLESTWNSVRHLVALSRSAK